MAYDLATLLERATPDDSAPIDLEALHRRGVRRRWTSRVAASGAGVAAVAIVAVAAGSLGAPAVVEVDPVAPPDTPATTPPDMVTSSKVAFAPSDDEVAEAAAALPGPGDTPDPGDWSVLVAHQPDDQMPWLRSNEVSCLYADGDGPTAAAPEGARSNRTWADTAATKDDLVAACLDSDSVRSELNHVPGPFRLCQGTPSHAARQEMLDDPGSGTVLTPDASLPPVTFPVIVTWDADCASIGSGGNGHVEVAPAPDEEALLAQFNERRRVETALRARAATECLAPVDALALARASVERFGQDWRILSLIDPTGVRSAPCVDVTMEPLWGTITLWPSSAARPSEFEPDVPSADAAARRAMADALRDGDHTVLEEMLDVVRSRVEGGIDAAAVEAMFADNEPARELVHFVHATGCLARDSAADLAWAVRDVLDEHAPRDRPIGQLEGSGAACFQVEVAGAAGVIPHAANGPSQEPYPDILLVPFWVD